MSIAISHIQGEESLWSLCLLELQEQLGAFAFNSWLLPLSYKGLEDGVVFLGVPNEMVRSWVEKHYTGLLQNTLRKIDPAVEMICLEVDPEGATALPELDPASIRPVRAAPAMPRPSHKATKRPQTVDVPAGFYKDYTFQNFVEGECNRLAFTVSRTVAENPGHNQANPLILYGGTGLGKTHLLQSIGRYALEHQTAQRIVYRTAEQFLKDYMSLVVKGQNNRAFNEIYCQADILLLDDIQILAKKESTQEELFKVLNRLMAQNKQVVLCSDQLPSQVPGLSRRLVERFSGGMSCSLEVPDLQTRIAILGRKASDLKMPPNQTEEILRWLARHHGSNVRELEGVIVKLLAFHNLLGYELDLEAVRQLMGEAVRSDKNGITLRDVTEATAYVFGVRSELLASRSRIKNISMPRKIAMYLCRELTDSSLQTIGMHFNRDYSTVISSLRTTEELIESNLVVQARVGEIRTMLQRN